MVLVLIVLVCLMCDCSWDVLVGLYGVQFVVLEVYPGMGCGMIGDICLSWCFV